jgi:hypothetical protein
MRHCAGQFSMALSVCLSPDHYKEFAMMTYLPALIWALSGIACLVISRRRLVKKTALRTVLVTLLGPIAIPFVLVAKPDNVIPA